MSKGKSNSNKVEPVYINKLRNEYYPDVTLVVFGDLLGIAGSTMGNILKNNETTRMIELSAYYFWRTLQLKKTSGPEQYIVTVHQEKNQETFRLLMDALKIEYMKI